MLKAFVGLALLLGVVGVPVAEAQLSKVCPVIKDFNNRVAIKALIQWKNHQVQRVGGPGTPLKPAVRQPTIIATQGKNPFALFRAVIYDKNGKKIVTSAIRQGCSVTRGECLARYKFPRDTPAIRKATSPDGAFVKVSNKLCIRIPNAGKCYNVKVRELCDGRTL